MSCQVNISWMKFILIGIISVLYLNSNAQDVHFSQYYKLPVYHNPALTTWGKEQHKFTVIYRNQWATVPVNYNSGLAQYETKLLQNTKENLKIGLGISMLFDKAGDSQLQTLKPEIALNTQLKLSDNKFIAAGFSLAFTHRRLDFSQLTFDEQFNGDVFIPNAPITEPMDNNSMNYLDLGTGLAYGFIGDVLQGTFGVSMYHFNKPKHSFYGDDYEIGMKYNFYGALNIIATDKFIYKIHGIYATQKPSNELVLGGMVEYKLDSKQATSIEFGLDYRLKDAIIPSFHYNFNSFRLGLSYDANGSDFKVATNTYGAIETSLIYTINSLPKFKSKRKVCPIF